MSTQFQINRCMNNLIRDSRGTPVQGAWTFGPSQTISVPGTNATPFLPTTQVLRLVGTAGCNIQNGPTTTTLTGLSVEVGGDGFSVGDVVTLTAVDGVTITPAQITVSTVALFPGQTTGSILTFTITNAGSFSTNPTSFVSDDNPDLPGGQTGNNAAFNTPTYSAGVPPVASATTSPYIPANTIVYIGINSGDKLAVVGAGTLYITEV